MFEVYSLGLGHGGGHGTGGKGVVCPHATNKSHYQGKDPSTRLLPWLSKRHTAFCMLYFLPSPEQDLGHRCQSELLFAFLENIYPLHFPSAKQLIGERSWCRAQARDRTIFAFLQVQQWCRAPGRIHTHLCPYRPPAGCSWKYGRGRFFSQFSGHCCRVFTDMFSSDVCCPLVMRSRGRDQSLSLLQQNLTLTLIKTPA